MTSPEGARGWLFGTVHALPDGLEWRTALVDEAFVDARVLLVELRPDELDATGSVFEQLDDSRQLPPLLDRFQGQERLQVQDALARAGLARGALDGSETWAAALMLATAARESDPQNGVDRALMARTAEIAGLESAQSQLGIFDGLPESEQRDLLLAVAEGVLANQSEASIEAWLTGDDDSFSVLADAGILADPELREALHAQRNRDWLPVIIGNISAGDEPFVAVGAAHMLGDDGLPALLEAAGYTVTRIQ